jgi:hypothetical protein
VLDVDLVDVAEEEVVVEAEVTELINEETLDSTDVRGRDVDNEVLRVRGMEVLIETLVSGLIEVVELLVTRTEEVVDEDDDDPVDVAGLVAYVIV